MTNKPKSYKYISIMSFRRRVCSMRRVERLWQTRQLNLHCSLHLVRGL